MASADPAATLSFYGDMFGWTGRTGSGYTILHLGDQPVAGLAKLGSAGPPAWLTYIATSDVDDTARAVKAAGGRVLIGPMDMADAGRTALFADPAGATFAVWQRGVFAGARVFNEPGALCWFELSTPDMAAAREFYGAVFNWRARADEIIPGAMEWINGEDSVAGVVEGSAGWSVFIMVDDSVEAAARLTARGGRTVGEPIDSPVCRYVRLADPQGATFVIAELAPQARSALCLGAPGK